MRDVGKEFGVVISPDLVFIFFARDLFVDQDDRRGRIKQEGTEDTEAMVSSALFSPFPPVRSFLLAANIACLNVRGQILRC